MKKRTAEQQEIDRRMGVFHGEAPVSTFAGGLFTLGPISREQAKKILATKPRPSTKSPEHARIAARMGLRSPAEGVHYERATGRYVLGSITPAEARRLLAKGREAESAEAVRLARLALAAGES